MLNIESEEEEEMLGQSKSRNDVFTITIFKCIFAPISKQIDKVDGVL